MDNIKGLTDLVVQSSYYKSLNTINDKAVFTFGFEAGFMLATSLQDKKLHAYAAYVNGSITRSELDEALKDD